MTPAAQAPSPAAASAEGQRDVLERIGWASFALALPALVVAAVLEPADVRAAASADWPPFVLVTGLLLCGLVARVDGLFDVAGAALARVARGTPSLFVGAAVLVAAVTAVLNLDTAVVFLTPVLLVSARRRGADEAPFCYLAVFLANGASLLLPGSNLTNLIVLGDLRQSGSAFAAKMVVPWLAGAVAVTAVVGARWHRTLRRRATHAAATPRTAAPPETPRLRWGAGAASVAVVVVSVLVLPAPSAAVVAMVAGAAAAAWTRSRRRLAVAEVRQTVNLPLLCGLFCVAVAFGTVGRLWTGPARLLAHASAPVTAMVGAAASVLVNNLPAASLLGARPIAHPHALLVGLDLGPNLAVTGALSAVLWLQVARSAGGHTSAWRYTRLGAVVTVVSMAAAVAALAVAL